MAISLSSLSYVLLHDDIDALVKMEPTLLAIKNDNTDLFNKFIASADVYKANRCKVYLETLVPPYANALESISLALLNNEEGAISYTLSAFKRIQGLSLPEFFIQHHDEAISWLSGTFDSHKKISDFKLIQRQKLTRKMIIQQLLLSLDTKEIVTLWCSDAFNVVINNNNEVSPNNIKFDLIASRFDNDPIDLPVLNELVRSLIERAQFINTYTSLFTLVLHLGDSQSIVTTLQTIEKRLKDNIPYHFSMVLKHKEYLPPEELNLVSFMNHLHDKVKLELTLKARLNLATCLDYIYQSENRAQDIHAGLLLAIDKFDNVPCNHIILYWLPHIIQASRSLSVFLTACNMQYLEPTLDYVKNHAKSQDLQMELILAGRKIKSAFEFDIYQECLVDLVKRFSAITEQLELEEFSIKTRRDTPVANINSALTIKYDILPALAIIYRSDFKALIEQKLHMPPEVLELLNTQYSVIELLNMAVTPKQKSTLLRLL